ncbi:hypothetical protein [Maricaulis sp. MIT060901]|uniref:DUF6197 family protein n=1 Tax=Maricaulis sp. MIT060901 TaxID=3096993 RepID=UPI00399AD069
MKRHIISASLGLAALGSTAMADCQGEIDRQIAAELETISDGMRVFRSVVETDRTDEQRALVEETFALLGDRKRPVNQTDLDILDCALERFSSEDVWDREDDRDCDLDDERFSIFCALALASVDVTGGYEHRRTALQEVRYIIAEQAEGRDYAHRMQDYNNDPRTGFEDARSTMSGARSVVAARLASQCS